MKKLAAMTLVLGALSANAFADMGAPTSGPASSSDNAAMAPAAPTNDAGAASMGAKPAMDASKDAAKDAGKDAPKDGKTEQSGDSKAESADKMTTGSDS